MLAAGWPLVDVVVLMYVGSDTGAPAPPIRREPHTGTGTLPEGVSSPLPPPRDDSKNATHQPNLLPALHLGPRQQQGDGLLCSSVGDTTLGREGIDWGGR